MAKKRKAPARGGSRGKAKDAGFEVQDSDQEEAAASGPQAGIETGLIFVTFVALIVGFVLAQMDLSNSYGDGWIF